MLAGVAGEEGGLSRTAVGGHGDGRAMEVRERLRVRGLERLGHVDVAARSVQGELIGKRDVDVAIGRLSELRKLRGLDVLDGPYLRVQHAAIERDGLFGAGRVNSSDDLRVAAKVLEDAA